MRIIIHARSINNSKIGNASLSGVYLFDLDLNIHKTHKSVTFLVKHSKFCRQPFLHGSMHYILSRVVIRLGKVFSLFRQIESPGDVTKECV